MYTGKPSISRLAADEGITNECGTYVTRRGVAPLSWPILLRLYTKLLPGVTVHQWAESEDVINSGIDPRRFVSFGIIKGFLRRVHRWPIILDRGSPLIEQIGHSRRRVGFDKNTRSSGATISTRAAGDSGLTRSGPGDSTFTLRTASSNASLGVSPRSELRTSPKSPLRRPLPLTTMRGSLSRSLNSAGETHPSNSSRRTLGTLRSGAIKIREERHQVLEESLLEYLDGNHHSDEIQVRFKMGWSQLEKLLGLEEVKQGKGSKGITVIYR